MNVTQTIALATLTACLSPLAQAATIGGSLRVNSCEITTPFHLTKAETLQLANKGYRLKVKRSEFQFGRFLQIYDYFEMKDGRMSVGDLYVRPVLSPSVIHPAYGQKVNYVSARELTFNVQLASGPRVIAMAQSAPPTIAKDSFQIRNANLDSMPACRE